MTLLSHFQNFFARSFFFNPTKMNFLSGRSHLFWVGKNAPFFHFATHVRMTSFVSQTQKVRKFKRTSLHTFLQIPKCCDSFTSVFLTQSFENFCGEHYERALVHMPHQFSFRVVVP